MGDEETPLIQPVTDNCRKYTADEERQLTAQYSQLAAEVAGGGFCGVPLTLDLLRGFHGRIFENVRDHAGKNRNGQRGSRRLNFGDRPGLERQNVEPALDETFEQAQQSITSHKDNPDDLAYDATAIRLASWTHMKVICIQPFEDGNKRTARILLNHILIDLGLGIVTFNLCRREYINALHAFYDGGQGIDDADSMAGLILNQYVARHFS